MLIDNAVAAFRAAEVPDLTIARSLVKAGNWIIVDSQQNRITRGTGHSLEECRQMREDAILAARLTAAMQEMISVKVLTMALINCGAPIPSAHPLAKNLLPAIVDLASQEDTDAVVNLHVVKDEPTDD
jgi:hypothetical protein